LSEVENKGDQDTGAIDTDTESKTETESKRYRQQAAQVAREEETSNGKDT
jgi:hypothetical protein